MQMRIIKDIIIGIIALLGSYLITDNLAEYVAWIETGEGMTISIIVIWAAIFYIIRKVI
jgi:hypothetical protein